MNDDEIAELRARLAVLPTLITTERHRELIALATIELPHVLDFLDMTGVPRPMMMVTERKGTQMLVHCDVCGQDHWEEDDGIWFAGVAL